MNAPQTIALTAGEIDALHGAGPLAFQLYILLRLWMDYRSGIVGRSRPISLAMLAAYSETHTPKGTGAHIEQPSPRNIRTALERLQRAGLIVRQRGDLLVYRLPQALTASARPAPTRHAPDTHLSTPPAHAKPAPHKESSPDRNATATPCPVPNPAHIKGQGKPSTLHTSSTHCTPVDGEVGKTDSSAAEALATYLAGQDIPTLWHRAMLARWARDGITVQQLGAAVALGRSLRARASSPQPLNPGYLDALLRTTMGTTPRPARADDSTLIATGTARGCPPRPGESWSEYRDRLARNSEISHHQGAAA